MISKRLTKVLRSETPPGLNHNNRVITGHAGKDALLLTLHELPIPLTSPPYTQQQFIGIVEGEGLLFRDDTPQNVAFHFKLDSNYPVDLEPVPILETKQRGSETLGLSPAKYELLMKVLKLLVNRSCQTDVVMALVEDSKQGVLSLDQYQALGLYTTELDGGATYWVITPRGQEYYTKQLEFINTLPVPLTSEEIQKVPLELKRLVHIWCHDVRQDYILNRLWNDEKAVQFSIGMGLRKWLDSHEDIRIWFEDPHTYRKGGKERKKKRDLVVVRLLPGYDQDKCYNYPREIPHEDLMICEIKYTWHGRPEIDSDIKYLETLMEEYGDKLLFIFCWLTYSDTVEAEDFYLEIDFLFFTMNQLEPTDNEYTLTVYFFIF